MIQDRLYARDAGKTTRIILTDQLDYRFEKKDKASQIANQQLEIALTIAWPRCDGEIHTADDTLRAEMSEHYQKSGLKPMSACARSESNEVRLEQMRQTVEEKLEKTFCNTVFADLLWDGFKTIGVGPTKGWEKMWTVARDVGTLNKVLSNTKTRGIMGELQLGQIIEDIWPQPSMSESLSPVPQSSERVNMPLSFRTRRGTSLSADWL